MSFDLKQICSFFDISGEFVCAESYGSGHINDTFAVCFQGRSAPKRYLLQRINNKVFKNIEALMDNISRVCSHLDAKLESQSADHKKFRSLKIIPARDGGNFYQDKQRNYWRVYDFIENARSYDVVGSYAIAYEAAKTFGRFQSLLSDLPGGPLNETIKGFHDTPTRFEFFKDAVNADPHGRVRNVQSEIDFYLSRENIAHCLHDKLLSGELPIRACHNDTKLNNLLVDPSSGKAICVIDLDTMSSSLAAYDFGDLVRTSTAPAAEDEINCDKVYMRPDMFEALVDGFLAGTAGTLSCEEIDSLPLGGLVITYECGMRFLTDYILGDTYFKIRRVDHNLHRCRTQIKLVESMEFQRDEILACIDNLWAKYFGG